MRLPAQLNLPGRGGSSFKFSSTLDWFIGRKKVRIKPVSSAPICLFSQVNSRTLGAVRSPLSSSSPIKTLSTSMRTIAMRSIGCLNGPIAKDEGLTFFLKILTNLSLLFLLKINYPIFLLNFTVLGALPTLRNPLFLAGERAATKYTDFRF